MSRKPAPRRQPCAHLHAIRRFALDVFVEPFLRPAAENPFGQRILKHQRSVQQLMCRPPHRHARRRPAGFGLHYLR